MSCTKLEEQHMKTMKLLSLVAAVGALAGSLHAAQAADMSPPPAAVPAPAANRLATARQLIEAHGGRLDMQSEKGAGTTATISLP